MKKSICLVSLLLAILMGISGCGYGGSQKFVKAIKDKINAVEQDEEKNTETEETRAAKETELLKETELSKDAENETDFGVAAEEENAGSDISRINYYDAEGKLIYYDSYAYYDNGLLCSTTLHSVGYLYDERSYIGDVYTVLYLYDENGKVDRTVIDALTISEWYNETTGEIILNYDDDGTGNSIKKSIYPAVESIEQEKFGVDTTKTEIIYGDAPIISTDSNSGWAAVYLKDIFSGDEPTDMTSAKFMYVNDDRAPELWMDYGYGYAGGEVYTAGNGTTDKVYLSHGIAYCVENSNRLLTSGGHMDVYYDTLYQIENGKFVTLEEGNYGALGNSNVQVDENGYPIYDYYWNDTAVTENEYKQRLEEVFDQEKTVDTDQNVYTFQQCKMLLEEIINFSK